MLKTLALTSAMATGLIMSSAVITTANAAPLAKAPAAAASAHNLVLARDGRGGGGQRAFGGARGGGPIYGAGSGRVGGARSFSGSRNFGGGVPRGINRGDFGGNRFRPGGGNWNKHGHRHRHNRRFYGGGGYYPYYSSYGYYGDYYGSSDCGWLRRKAVRTGSSYWWSRYERCVSDY